MKINNRLNLFALLPVGVNLHILSYIPDSDLIKRISLVCRQFNELSNDQNRWKERTICLFGRVKAAQSFFETKNWKLSYILGPDGYISESKDGIGNFRGKRVYSSKNEEIGEFQNYILIKGLKIHHNGIIYEGEFKDHQLNGHGKITYRNGTIYEGRFKNNALNGHGKIIGRDGTVIYEGRFKNGNSRGDCNIL